MRALALLALTGCTQIFGLSDPVPQGPPADASGSDAPITPMDVAADMAASGGCNPAQIDVLACFDFEGSIVDGSSSGHVITTVANVVFGSTGGPDGTFATVGPTSAISIAASTAFNTSAFTVTAWVRLDALPGPASRVGVFDSDGRYGLFIDGSGSMLVRGIASPQGSIGVGAWTHLAVSDDGSMVRFYVNGVPNSTASTATAVPTSNLASEIGGNAPTGDRMSGSIDKLRVFRRVLSPTEVAAEAL